MCMFLYVMWRNWKMLNYLFVFLITYLPAVYTGSHMGATFVGRCEDEQQFDWNLMKLHLIYCCFRQTTGTVRALLCHKHNNPLELKAWCLSRWSPGCRRKAGCTWLSSFCWWQSGKQKNVTLSLQSLKSSQLTLIIYLRCWQLQAL